MTRYGCGGWQEWGESGYFRIRRGDDDSAFESMAVAADVVVSLPPRRGTGGAAARRRPKAEHTLQPERVEEPSAEREASSSLWGGLRAVRAALDVGAWNL